MSNPLTEAYVRSRVGAQGPYPGQTTQDALRTGAQGELITGDTFADLVRAKKVFCASNQTAVTWGTALTATGVTTHLSNPKSSPVDLEVLGVGLTLLTCTTAGSIVLAANIDITAAEVTHGTPGTTRNMFLGGPAGEGKFDVAATLPAAPVAIMPLAGVIGITTTTDAVGPNWIWRPQPQPIILPPGTALSIQGITIVGTGLGGFIWHERPRA